MSDEKRPTSIADAKMAKALGLPVGSVMVAELSDDSLWRRPPLGVVNGLVRAVSMLGLRDGKDWPAELAGGDPCFELFEACESLGDALSSLRSSVTRYAERFGPGEPEARALSEAWASQLEALMRSMHSAAHTARRLVKSEDGRESAEAAVRKLASEVLEGHR